MTTYMRITQKILRAGQAPDDWVIQGAILEVKAVLDAKYSSLIEKFHCLKTIKDLQQQGIELNLNKKQQTILIHLQTQLKGFFQ